MMSKQEKLGYIQDGEPTDRQIELQDCLDNLANDYFEDLKELIQNFELNGGKSIKSEWDIQVIYELNRLGLERYDLNIDDVY